MKKPDLFETAGSHRFKCQLCPHFCTLASGMRGICRVRSADETGIHSPLHPVTVIAVDPIEKKPFYHFLPGSSSLSIGFAGCNLKCPFCQNHNLVDSTAFEETINPEYILKEALRMSLPSVSFTYSEPLIHIEFIAETASLLKDHGISPLLVTNGCINSDPGKWLLSHLDGVKVDLKSFNPDWYRNELNGDLDAVKHFITMASDMTHLEVVTLVIPGKNDSVREIKDAARFLSGLNPDIPYHLTAYFPQHYYTVPPTTALLLESLKSTASEALNYVYTGNTGRLESTVCSSCGSVVINRLSGQKRLSREGQCLSCGKSIYGRFS